MGDPRTQGAGVRHGGSQFVGIPGKGKIQRVRQAKIIVLRSDNLFRQQDLMGGYALFLRHGRYLQQHARREPKRRQKLQIRGQMRDAGVACLPRRSMRPPLGWKSHPGSGSWTERKGHGIDQTRRYATTRRQWSSLCRTIMT